MLAMEKWRNPRNPNFRRFYRIKQFSFQIGCGHSISRQGCLPYHLFCCIFHCPQYMFYGGKNIWAQIQMVSIWVKLPSVLVLSTKYYSNILIHGNMIYFCRVFLSLLELNSKTICSASVHNSIPTPFGKCRTPSSNLPHDRRQWSIWLGVIQGYCNWSLLIFDDHTTTVVLTRRKSIGYWDSPHRRIKGKFIYIHIYKLFC